MIYKNSLNLIATILISFYSFGQIGITGTVIDGDFNEPLPFANILILETGDGVTSDFDGKYSFELPAGTYSIQFSFVGYETKIITEIEVGGDGLLHTANGKYLQIRTKDSAPYSPIFSNIYGREISSKNFAFYFQKSFVHELQK